MSRVSADLRGSNTDRHARRLWLIDNYGDGKTAPCFWCGCKLTKRTLEVDRYPICGHDGGTYRRNNIVPACPKCNRGRCSICKHRPRRTRQGNGSAYDPPSESTEPYYMPGVGMVPAGGLAESA